MATDGLALIRRMATGDREALGAFYDAYASLAFGLVRRVLGDPDEAAEVVQDVFWELWKAAPLYDPARGTPEAWITVRARSRAIDRLRTTRRRDEMLGQPLSEATTANPESAADSPVARLEERELVRGALRELPDNQRTVIELAYLRGLTQSEISTRLAQPLGTVKTRMRLGMERLREILGPRV
jgi:RNA polymerase sigma-70 factor (ECF subfamily)